MTRALPVLFLVAGCTCASEPARTAERTPSHGEPLAHEDTHAPAEPRARRTFGSSIDESLPMTPLASIIAEPGAHAERIVRTRGVVHRVCQRMGCWMELRDGDGPAVRVPMAGHAFLLPRDSQGERAEVQGRVELHELSPEARAHLGSEGATALASMVSISATAVRLGE
jgi:hypothetical protein